ncbi:hypothetical protein EVJ58_g10896 [Rhodofomes roseus]|uniref:Reverse transcriptase n=1 Tax=Rhodofomes roseus TaxID=34475 RepID=A0A4Y9XNJ0_9APHY|nr:hypothetical protein EVJ58_g10896 [Rhodofomes roseus]
MDKFKGAKIFTKMDLRAGYNNVRIKEGDEWKAAFAVPGSNQGPPRLYEPTVMFFGLCNSPSTFQRMMNSIFEDMLAEGWLVIYMDDILIYSADTATHHERTRRVLQRLKDHDLYLKPEKCHFDVTEVEFLGMIIRPDTIAMDPVKVSGIADWPVPESVKQVRSFVGFANFYRRFILHFSERARPLVDLTKKDVRWHWDEEQQLAFEDLKHEFTRAPTLVMPDETRPFALECDASKFATGGVLLQSDANGDLHPCGFISQSLNPAERNYEIYDRELLSIIRGLETWKHYFLGSPHKLQIRSDHRNLTYWRTAQKLNRRQARWSLFLSEFDYELAHVPGTQMTIADLLSRRSDHDTGADDNDDIVMLAPQLFVRAINADLLDRLRDCHEKEPMVKEAFDALLGKGPAPAKTSLTDWQTDGNLVWYQSRVYVPPDAGLRRNVVRLYHELPSAGHPGIHKTTTLVQRDFWWPGMGQFIARYVKGCGICQQMKPNTHPTVTPLIPIPPQHPATPFSCQTMDFITALPETPRGHNAIYVVVDHDSTKGVIFIPCTDQVDAETTAKMNHDHVYRRFGLARKFISDRGPQFASKVMGELCRLTGIERALSTAYHPQTDGQTERANQELEIFLRIFCANNPETWDEMLPDAEFAHNSRPHSAIKMSPFYAMMGYEPRGIPHITEVADSPTTEERLKRLQKAREEAAFALEAAQRVIEKRIKDRTPAFKKDQQVWLDTRHLRLPYATRKLAPKKEGPFKITEVMGRATYRLQLPPQWRIHPVFHAGLLSPYNETEEHGPTYTEPPPDEVDGENSWEFEAILGHKGTASRRRYLVKWKGYPPSENSWEPEDVFLGTGEETLDEYKRAHHLRLLYEYKEKSRLGVVRLGPQDDNACDC